MRGHWRPGGSRRASLIHPLAQRLLRRVRPEQFAREIGNLFHLVAVDLDDERLTAREVSVERGLTDTRLLRNGTERDVGGMGQLGDCHFQDALAIL